MPSRTLPIEEMTVSESSPATSQKHPESVSNSLGDDSGAGSDKECDISVVPKASRKREKRDGAKKSKKKNKEKKSGEKVARKSKHGDSDSITPAQLPRRKSIESISPSLSQDQESSKKSPKKISVARTKSGSAADDANDPKMTTKVKRSQSATVEDTSSLKNAPKILKPSSYKLEKAKKPSSIKGVPLDTIGESTKPVSKKKSKKESTPSSEDDKAAAKVASMQVRASIQKNMDQQEQDLQAKIAAQPPQSPSKSRAGIMQRLESQESNLESPKSMEAAAKPRAMEQPGAYSVHGQSVARAESGILSPQGEATKANRNADQRPRTSSRNAHLSGLDQEQPMTASSASASKGLVVAAALSSDLEANIEEEVRRKILSQAAKAQVVPVTQRFPILDPTEEARRLADLRELHKPKGVRERLFGDARNSDVDIATSPEAIRKRNYLKWTVKRNQATNMWVATVQTKQKAIEQNNIIEIERTSVSFSATTQQEAFETGLANAVPMMQPTEEHPICYVCKAKFALFRRPQHCRNCGVCICSNCTVQWPNVMFPDTFGAKATNNVCSACDWLASSFRDSLLEGSYKTALHLYATGNINIRSAFCGDKKAESMHPVHSAVLGGNMKLLKWLIEERYCPLTTARKPSRGKKSTESPILTSKGRSPLAIAMLHQKLDIVRYLVADAGISLFDENDANNRLALANFTTVLRMLPNDFFEGKFAKPTGTTIPQSLSSESFRGGTSSSAARRPSM